MTTIVWLRRDLRLTDNAALAAAAELGPVVPVYIHAPEEEAPWEPTGAGLVWLHESLERLAPRLARLGAALILRRGGSLATLRQLIQEVGARRVFWNRLYDPTTIPRDKAVKEALRKEGIDAQSFAGALLHEPTVVRNKEGRPFQVFTPFWRNVEGMGAPAEPLPAPRRLLAAASPVESLPLEALGLLPRIAWDSGIRSDWSFGEEGALQRLDHFLESIASGYGEKRNNPDVDGTSRLSPHLHFGEITPRLIWHRAEEAIRQGRAGKTSTHHFVREVGWREFSAHLLYHFPHTHNQPLRPEFALFPWKRDPRLLRAWQKGRTGYPIVDAGMRQLWHTGWMHNRVRMIVGSFLVKHLLQPWQDGARWFWDTLVDADLANNSMGWQWTAGSGADAAPYFRVFNPVLQAEKFDAAGAYVRKWVPELARLPNTLIHKPWEATAGQLAVAGVRLGDTYPRPIVNHTAARDAALQAWEGLKAARGGAVSADLLSGTSGSEVS